MEECRIPFLRETASLAIHPSDGKRFDCTLAILNEVSRVDKLYQLVLRYKQEVERLREAFLQNLQRIK